MKTKLIAVLTVLILILAGCSKKIESEIDDIQELQKLSNDDLKALVDSVQIEKEIRAAEDGDELLTNKE